MSITESPVQSDQSLWVICLCAQWCGLCRDYRLVLEQAAAKNPALSFAWVDIEDEADLVGEVDIETFPTLLVADHHGVRFMGPLMPHAETLSRLLASLQQTGATVSTHTGLTQSLLDGAGQRHDLWVTNNKKGL